MKNEFNPSELQVLFLWRLFFLPGHGGWGNEIKPALKSADRKELEAVGLLRSEKKGATHRLYVSLTDQAWDWAVSHLNAPVSKRSPAAGYVVQDLLSCLARQLGAGRLSLAEFSGGLTERGSASSAPEEQPSRQLAVEIRRAYGECSGGRTNVRVRLADLRKRLGGIDRAALDEQLLQMQQLRELVLYPLDDGLDIQKRDVDAALQLAGSPRHILYMEATK